MTHRSELLISEQSHAVGTCDRHRGSGGAPLVPRPAGDAVAPGRVRNMGSFTAKDLLNKAQILQPHPQAGSGPGKSPSISGGIVYIAAYEAPQPFR